MRCTIRAVTESRPAASPTLGSPKTAGMRAHRGAYGAAAQHRIDAGLGEERTPAWGRLDLGVRFDFGAAIVLVDVENLTDTSYHRHLAYLRDPFASGVSVYEPGRHLRVSVRYGS